MQKTIFAPALGARGEVVAALESVLSKLDLPYGFGDRVGIKLHWGERGNKSFLSPEYVRALVRLLLDKGLKPCVIDTTVLYSGGRRNGMDALKTAADHGYTEDYLGCPVIIADGLDGREVVEIPAHYRHFRTVQAAAAVTNLAGFLIFSHFKGHMVSGFGGAIKNISMGLASRAQKQRMHADARPTLSEKKCRRCGVCIEVCPVGAASMEQDSYPVYDLAVCIGCAQCIAMCPELALRVIWGTDTLVFQEKLVETAAAIWRQMEKKAVLINMLLNITSECDCMSGQHPRISPDLGIVGGYHPLAVDEESVSRVGPLPIDQAHPGVPWRHQFVYARAIGFVP